MPPAVHRVTVPTANERKALGFFVLVALSGSAVRVWRARLPPVPQASAAALERQLDRVDSARRTAGGRARKAKAPAPPEGGRRVPVDIDRADSAELESLPGIGPALARRIVSHRDSAGGLGSMDALCEVKGVGKALSERLSPLVTFSAPRRPVSATCGEGSKSPRNSRKPREQEWR